VGTTDTPGNFILVREVFIFRCTTVKSSFDLFPVVDDGDDLYAKIEDGNKIIDNAFTGNTANNDAGEIEAYHLIFKRITNG